MLEKVLTTIKKHNMIKAGDNVVCALSGGADSMALLCALYEIKEKLGFSLYAANLNHSIRGEEGDSDSEFVRDFCEKSGIKLFEKKVDIPALAKINGMSEEECGREERYLFFEEVTKMLGGGIVATGHHMNDNAETVLFNLFRGSGAKGMCGIPYKRGNIIRPLLNIKKSEIENYLSEKGVKWREDSSNSDCKYARNKIRNIIIKEIEKHFPDAVWKISNAAEAIRCDDEYLSLLAEESDAFSDGKIYTEKFAMLHESLQKRVVIRALKEWGCEDIDSKKINALIDTAFGTTGKYRDFGKDLRIVNNYGVIESVEKKALLKDRENYNIKVGENLEISAFEGIWSIKTVDKMPKMRDNKMMILLDADKLGGVVTLRCRKDGDYIYPSGLGGRKKLKKIFIDLKISKEVRDSIPLLTIGDEVLFIPGIRKTENYKTTENTKVFFVAEYAIKKKERNYEKQI